MKQHILFYAMAVIMMTAVTSCVEDAELPDTYDIYLKASAEVTDEYIRLVADVESDGNQVSERGFFLKRTIMSTYSDKTKDISTTYKIPDEQSAFEVKLDDLQGNIADYEVYAYVTIGGKRIYRSETKYFKVTVPRPVVIDSVIITANSDNVTGRIILQGKNFSLNKYDDILGVEEENLPGRIEIYQAEEPTTTSTIYNYRCNNIGEFTLYLSRQDYKVILDKKLEIKGPKLIGISPENPQAGEWIELILEDVPKDSKFYFKDIEFKNYKQENGKHYVFYPKVPERLTTYPCYDYTPTYYEVTVYLPPVDIHFANHWIYHANAEDKGNLNNIVGNTSYSLYDETLYCYTFKDDKLETYPINLHENGIQMVYQGDPKASCIMGNYLYAFVYAHSLAEDHSFDTVVLRINLTTKEWEIYDKYPHPSHSSGFTATVCKDFILIKYNSDYENITVYNPEKKEAKTIDMDWKDLTLIGEYGNYFYYIEVTDKITFKRVKTSDWNVVETLGNYSTSNVLSAQIHNGYIYFANQYYVSRMKIGEEVGEVEALGAPYEIRLYSVYPTDDGIYAADYYQNIYQYNSKH